jgi:hypothetical protein
MVMAIHLPAELLGRSGFIRSNHNVAQPFAGGVELVKLRAS